MRTDDVFMEIKKFLLEESLFSLAMTEMEKVEGSNDEHDVKIYTISTCGWCNKTKKLLKSLDVEYRYVDVDDLSGEERDEAREELKDYNPKMSTPTIVIDDGEEVIVGFKQDKLEDILA